MSDRPESDLRSSSSHPSHAIVNPVHPSFQNSLATVLASPQAMTLIGNLTSRYISLGVRPPRYPQELESCVTGESWESGDTKDRNLLFSVAHHSSMEMLSAEGRPTFNRHQDMAEVSGVALLEREGARSGGSDRLWLLLQTIAGSLAKASGEMAKDCRVEFRHAKAFNWLPTGKENGSVLTTTCFRIRYEGMTRAELNQLVSDAMTEFGAQSRAERFSLHRCYHA